MRFDYVRTKPFLMLLTVFLLIALFTTTCFAQSNQASSTAPATTRTISVTGTADVMVMPDEAVFSFAVETSNVDINKAKSENDASIKKIKAITNEMKIDSKHVVTDYINVNPKYTYKNNGEQEFNGYTIHRGLVITLKDLSKFDELLTKLLGAGANNIQNVQFKTTQLRKYKDEARALAIKAAKEKAAALSKELGQTVGKASMIQEVQDDTYSYYMPWSSYGYSGANWLSNANAISNSAAPGSQGSTASVESETFSPGQIKVTARVSVTFDLN